MKAVVLVKQGPADKAFEIQEMDKPAIKPHEVLVQVDAFGLNFADVMARLGYYEDCPPLPAIIGYDVVGTIDEVGTEVSHLKKGQRVMALSRFGGYAEFVATDARAAVAIDASISDGIATALATQCGTAYYCAEEMVRLHPGDHVLIQAAAGGVGSALVQMAKHRGCIVYGTASTKKQDFLRSLGVDHPIDYRNTDFEEVIKKQRGGEGLDVIFDSIGGQSVKKGLKLLGHGGRIVLYGAASMTDTNKNIFKMIKVGTGFGLHSPIKFLKNSQSMMGVNMLRIADHRPETLKRSLEGAVKMAQDGILTPHIGGEFKVDQIAEAHEFLASRKSMGKVVVSWK